MAVKEIKEDDFIYFDKITKAEIASLFILLSREFQTHIPVREIYDHDDFAFISKDIPLEKFGLFSESLKRVYIIVRGRKSYAKKSRPLIGFNLQWVLESPHWSPRQVEIRKSGSPLLAWFNIKERTWELLTR